MGLTVKIEITLLNKNWNQFDLQLFIQKFMPMDFWDSSNWGGDYTFVHNKNNNCTNLDQE